MVDAVRRTYSEPPQPDARRFGRYTLRYRVAHGGMASVYLAQLKSGPKFQKWVAVKLVHPRMEHDERFVAMFMHEAQLLSRLEHPHVCSVLDFGQSDRTHYIAMEYLHGESLASLLRRSEAAREPVPMAIGARIVSDVARGLHAAHELKNEDGSNAGVVHRDVSPQNVFVLYQGLSKIVDFGIAQSTSREELTKTGELKGKFHYMSPEQVNQEPTDRRSDVFALGIVLWEVTVGQGKRLFKRERELDTLLAVINEPIAMPSAHQADYPPALEAIVVRALDRDPAKRYQTMDEMARALGQFITSAGGADHPDVSDWMQRIFEDRMRARDELLKSDGVTNEVPVVELESQSESVVPETVVEVPTAVAKPRIVGRERLGRASAGPSIAARVGVGVVLVVLASVIGWMSWGRSAALPNIVAPPAPSAAPASVVAPPPASHAEVGPPEPPLSAITPPPSGSAAPPPTHTRDRIRATAPATATPPTTHETAPAPPASAAHGPAHVGPQIMTNFEDME